MKFAKPRLTQDLDGEPGKVLLASESANIFLRFYLKFITYLESVTEIEIIRCSNLIKKSPLEGSNLLMGILRSMWNDPVIQIVDMTGL